MRCPFCGAQDTKVVDSRLHGDGDQVRRRRECTICKERFTTYETAELNLPRVVKSDGRRVNFDGRKLRAGIERSLEKRAGVDGGHRCGDQSHHASPDGRAARARCRRARSASW